MTKYIALNSPDGDKPIKMVSDLEKAVQLCLTYSRGRYSTPRNPCAVGKIFVPKLVVDEKKGEYFWTDEEERLENKGEYFFIVDGLGYYPGNDYPIIKPDGWFHYTEITPFGNMTFLMDCRMNEYGCYNYGEFESRTYKKGKHKTFYARKVFDVKKEKSQNL
jgi:hypothetical protein